MLRIRVLRSLLAAGLLVATLPSGHALADGEGSLVFNLAAGGACHKFKGRAELACGFGVTFASYVYTNRKKIVYLLAWSGGKMAKVTTPCVRANGVDYYCL